MSKLSLYEANWINLVFENKNKEYGAYQLRQESAKTSLLALFTGLLLCATLASIPRVISLINPEKDIPALTPESIDRIIQVTKIFPSQVKKIKEPVVSKVIQKKTAVLIEKQQFTNPTIVKAELATPNIAKNIENTAAISDSSDGLAIIGVNPTSSEGTGNGTPAIIDFGNTVVTSAVLDKLPEFPGGIAKFYTYIGKNFESPEINEARNIRIYVSFVVEKDGSMTDVQVKNDPGYGLGKEAIRVLKSLRTKWTPGMIGSKPVRTAYNLPITVQMN
ncbi:energy transducer TonB [Flavobacterium sp. Arc2]|jgi:protein TonB|uniref:energy transducer TonB n=1 Tax=Flavobacterium sp. Arc2 TaxID=3046685 RepID=UPI00352CB286